MTRSPSPLALGVLARALGVLALALALAGCIRVGRSGRDLGPAQGPFGARVSVRTDAGRIDGELLAVQEEGLLVLGAPPHLTLVGFRAVRIPTTVEFVALGDGTPVTPQEREDLRLLSRFPQGVPPAYLDRLLRDAGQPAPDVVR